MPRELRGPDERFPSAWAYDFPLKEGDWHPWIRGFSGVSQPEAQQLLSERWGQFDSTPLQPLTDLLVNSRAVKVVRQDEHQWLCLLPALEDDYQGCFYVPPPRIESDRVVIPNLQCPQASWWVTFANEFQWMAEELPIILNIFFNEGFASVPSSDDCRLPGDGEFLPIFSDPGGNTLFLDQKTGEVWWHIFSLNRSVLYADDFVGFIRGYVELRKTSGEFVLEDRFFEGLE